MLLKWKRPRFIYIFISTIAFAGLSLVILPSGASWVSQSIFSDEIRELSNNSVSIQPQARELALYEAHEYNQGLIGSVKIAANSNKPISSISQEGRDYTQILTADEQGLMARIKIPSIQVDLPVYHGTNDRTLEMGVGHLQGSSLPVGGSNTHSVLTAHRGLAKAELFTNLDRLRGGDRFTIEVFGEVLTYEVFETRVVEPADTESLYPQVDRDLVTLVTCTPLGVNSHRILVTAERVTPTPVEDVLAAGSPPDIPGFPWWGFWFLLGSVAIVGYLLANSTEKVIKTIV